MKRAASHGEQRQRRRSGVDFVPNGKGFGAKLGWEISAVAEVRMEAVTIHDTRQFGGMSVLAYDLADLLALAGPDALASSWSCKMGECFGPGAKDLYEAAEVGLVSGVRLAELAANVTQTIDGSFEATLPGADRPWLVLRAIDSSYFVVVTRSEMLLAELRRRFRDVRPSPADAEWYH
jgi:hypothetical protein